MKGRRPLVLSQGVSILSISSRCQFKNKDFNLEAAGG